MFTFTDARCKSTDALASSVLVRNLANTLTGTLLHLQVAAKWSGKIFAEWRPLLRRNPIHNLKPPAKAIMHTFLLSFVMSEPSPLAIMITGSISLGLLTIFLRHKLG